MPDQKPPFAELRIALGDSDADGRVDIDAVLMFQGRPLVDPDPLNVDAMTAYRVFGLLGSLFAQFRALVGF